jgi:ATP-binding cassette subfamily C (CFTR/MRP) protein 1
MLDLVFTIFIAIFVCLGSTYMATSIPVIVAAVYFVQRYYLRTSKQLRLLDLEAKAPVYSHFSETLEGISTIRAFGWEEYFQETALAGLDKSQKPAYLMFCIQRWLNLVLGLTSGAMGVVVIALALLIPSSSDPGLLGIALTSVLQFTSGIGAAGEMWTELETAFTSVTRTRKFEQDTPNEDIDGGQEPKADWPCGDIEFSDMGVTFE